MEVATVGSENASKVTGQAICSSCKRVGDLTEGELIPFNATLKVVGATTFTKGA